MATETVSDERPAATETRVAALDQLDEALRRIALLAEAFDAHLSEYHGCVIERAEMRDAFQLIIEQCRLAYPARAIAQALREQLLEEVAHG